MKFPSFKFPTNSRLVKILGVSLTVAAVVQGLKQVGIFEGWELDTYDRAVRIRPKSPPDNRLLIVKIGEAEIKNGWPLSDRTIARTIQKLTDGGATIIGLDNFRATPVQPGNAELNRIWDKSEVIVPGCHHLSVKNTGVTGPPGIPPEQLGFVDVSVDLDSVVRRALLFMERPPNSPCTSQISLGMMLAQEYLMRTHPDLKFSFDSQRDFQIDGVKFAPLKSTSGGYQNAEKEGYQILLDYRSPDNIAPSVTMTDLLQDKVPPALIKDKLVLIGSTASSLKDEFITPYSAGKARDATMPGVIVHAQISSQIIAHVLDRRPLWWFIPDWLEGVAIAIACGIGGTVAWYVRHPFKLVLATGGIAIVLFGGWSIVFLNSGWLPIISPLIGLIGSSIGVLGLTSYEIQQQQKKMSALAQTQQNTIDALQLLLERTAIPATIVPNSPLAQTVMPGTTMPMDDTIAGYGNLEATYIPGGSIDNPYANRILNDRYQIDRVLGTGGFGVTYLAIDTHKTGHPPCAIKQLVPARRDAQFVNLARRLFDTEAEILSTLGHHPQIPTLIDYFEDRQEFYLVEEFIDGTPLDRVFEEIDAPWAESQVIDLLCQLLPVLDFMHSQYAIHRDLKPANIIRRHADGKLVTIDFGAVKQINPQLPDSNETVAIGTRGYTPPEQFAGKPNFSSDIYALGRIAIEALTNIPPRDLPMDDATGNICWRDRANTSRELADIIDKMVTYSFLDRYQSAATVLVDLAKID
jgi:CHASE2 domain-containing sensor protein